MSDALLDVAERCPGKTKSPKWTGPKPIHEGLRNSPDMRVDPDIYINLGPGSRYQFSNPEDVVEWSRIGEESSYLHDGSCGMLQATLKRAPEEEEKIKQMLIDLSEQLGPGVLAALDRAYTTTKDPDPHEDNAHRFEKILNILCTCKSGRHRAEVGAWLIRAVFEALFDVEVVVIRRHHLRSGPHDNRGPCGCAQNFCHLIKKEDRPAFGRLSSELRDECRRWIRWLAQKHPNLRDTFKLGGPDCPEICRMPSYMHARPLRREHQQRANPNIEITSEGSTDIFDSDRTAASSVCDESGVSPTVAEGPMDAIEEASSLSLLHGDPVRDDTGVQDYNLIQVLTGGVFYNHHARAYQGHPSVTRKNLKPEQLTELNRFSWKHEHGWELPLTFLGKGNHQATWAVHKRWVVKLDFWQCKQDQPNIHQPHGRPVVPGESTRDMIVRWSAKYPFLPRSIASSRNPYVHFQERGAYTRWMST